MVDLPCSRREYKALYESVAYITDSCETHYSRIRIPDKAAERDVYALLPWAPDCEYAGYITRHYVYFRKGGPNASSPPLNRDVTWHSHPRKSREADLPSSGDLFACLKWAPIRSIVVGSENIWVFDKTRHTLPVVRQMQEWESEHQIDSIYNAIDKAEKHKDSVTNAYGYAALKALGFDYRSFMGRIDPRYHWVEEVRLRLKLRVRGMPVRPAA
jgi:hypothetical protein